MHMQVTGLWVETLYRNPYTCDIERCTFKGQGYTYILEENNLVPMIESMPKLGNRQVAL